MPLKVVVTGASGLLGRAVVDRLTKADGRTVACVEGWALNRTAEKYRKVDITNESDVRRAVAEFKPDVIVHSAAIRAPDVVEQQYEFSRNVNVDASRNLAKLASERNAYIIYISTDYVFDGASPPYDENAKPNPLNKYGQLKLEGEIAVADETKNYAILRVPILYGPVEYLGEGAVDVILKALLAKEKPCKMSHYERRYPTHVDDVAGAIEALLTNYVKDESSARGVFHWSGDEMMTKYDMTRAMSRVFNLSMDHVIPVEGADAGSAAQRPYNSHLACEKLKQLGASNCYTFDKGCLQSYKNMLK